MNSCIIHIGMHKTGSTSIQQSLQGFSNDEFVYADIDRKTPNHSLAIYSLFADHPENHHLHRCFSAESSSVREYAASMLKNLNKSIEESNGRTLIISGEDISYLSSHALVKLKDFFQRYFAKLTVVGYVRSPAGFITSSFQEGVKGGVIHALNVKLLYRNYEHTFGRFDAVFGRENVHLWKFDPTAFPGGCVVRDFCKRLHISLPQERIVRVNESLSRQVVALLFTYRKLWEKKSQVQIMRGSEAVQLGKFLIDIGVGNDQFRLSPDIIKPVIDANRADIAWIEARVGQSFHDELGKHQPGDIKDESDLLNHDVEVVRKLKKIVGYDAADSLSENTRSEDAAFLIHQIRIRGFVRTAKLLDAVSLMTPDVMNGIPKDKAIRLVFKIFEHINKKLITMTNDTVSYANLGTFLIEKVQDENNEKTQRNTRIIFKPEKIKENELFWHISKSKHEREHRYTNKTKGRCIIHIGMRKTGSSSIQQSLNRFADNTVVFADINGHPNHGGVLYGLFADHPERFHLFKKWGMYSEKMKNYIQTARTGLDQAIEMASGRTVIFSAEGCRLFTVRELKRIREFFLSKFERVEIVGYVRPPAAYLNSTFQERVKDAATKLDLDKDYFFYKSNFAKFDKVFGRKNVYLWKFDPRVFPNGCVVQDFCDKLNIRLPVERIIRVNESLSREAVALLFIYRKFGASLGSTKMLGRENRELVNKIKSIGKNRFRFSPEIVLPVIHKNHTDIEWMEARLGQSLYEELGEHQEGDVRSESDLLKVEPETISELLLLVDQIPAGIRGETLDEIATLVHALRFSNTQVLHK